MKPAVGEYTAVFISTYRVFRQINGGVPMAAGKNVSKPMCSQTF
jgi:hypothetical protein